MRWNYLVSTWSKFCHFTPGRWKIAPHNQMSDHSGKVNEDPDYTHMTTVVQWHIHMIVEHKLNLVVDLWSSHWPPLLASTIIGSTWHNTCVRALIRESRKYKLCECKFVEVSTRWNSQTSLYVWTYPHSSTSSHEGVWSIYVIQVILILILFTRFPADAPSSPCAASLSSWPWYECPRSPQASWNAIPAKVIHEYHEIHSWLTLAICLFWCGVLQTPHHWEICAHVPPLSV